MKKEVIVCDECGKILQENEVDKFMFELWWFDLCSNCKEKKSGLKEKVAELNDMYDKRKKEIFEEYSLNKLIYRGKE